MNETAAAKGGKNKRRLCSRTCGVVVQNIFKILTELARNSKVSPKSSKTIDFAIIGLFDLQNFLEIQH